MTQVGRTGIGGQSNPNIRSHNSTMDSRTIAYYRANAEEVAKRYESAQGVLAGRFAAAFAPGGKVLDIGLGSGRDMAELMRQGFEPYGIDGTPELITQAQLTHPQLKDRMALGVLPEFEIPFGGEFDGILCCAVLMHLETTELFNAALAMKRCLKINGRLLLSVPTQRSDTNAENRDAHGRLFNLLHPGYLQLLFERLGFSLIDQWNNSDSMSRQGIEWVSMVFQLQSAANTRSIDQIEGVLNHDQKSATYKFALFRALAELATQSPNSVVWRPEGRVGLPVGFVAEKWLQYYWPLVESQTFIPQLNGETATSDKSIKFRRNLERLIAAYALQGGYSGFRIARNKGLLPPAHQKILKEVMADITYAIVNGPVVYAGGALSTGRVFDYDAASKQILIPNDLWMELSHLGYWVGQAVILQWAEKTARLGQGIEVANVVNLLLDREDERSTTEARRIFADIPDLECVWTGASIKSRYDIDHVIPFDLWHNNDMWNLLPASPKANNAKRNKLPSTPMLTQRKDCIISYWEFLRQENPAQFDKEALTLGAIRQSNWQNELYAQMCNAIEVTALQRGVGRWGASVRAHNKYANDLIRASSTNGRDFFDHE